MKLKHAHLLTKNLDIFFDFQDRHSSKWSVSRLKIASRLFSCFQWWNSLKITSPPFFCLIWIRQTFIINGLILTCWDRNWCPWPNIDKPNAWWQIRLGSRCWPSGERGSMSQFTFYSSLKWLATWVCLLRSRRSTSLGKWLATIEFLSPTSFVSFSSHIFIAPTTTTPQLLMAGSQHTLEVMAWEDERETRNIDVTTFQFQTTSLPPLENDTSWTI